MNLKDRVSASFGSIGMVKSCFGNRGDGSEVVVVVVAGRWEEVAKKDALAILGGAAVLPRPRPLPLPDMRK